MGYIREIQGLRAVAALLVAVYHIWFSRVSGGVDAFFVIASFFLMTSFARVGHPGGGDVLRYWASTVRRVVPLAAVVILATILGTLLFVPRLHWREFAFHGLASTLFVENWWLAWTGTDYLRLGLAVSPFQQMWALSLQMQFYLVLPLLLWGVAALAKYRRASLRRAWTWVLAGLCLLSFAYAVWITAKNQPWAYFDSGARAWEYMAGALLALHLDSLPRLSLRFARLLGYVCLLVLVSFAAVIPVAHSFPGWATLIPVLSTLGLIAAARAGAGIAPLTSRPMMALGDISFSFYLWHWPLLIFWRQWGGETSMAVIPGLGVILLAGALAWATLRLVETPVRRWPPLVERPVLSLVAGALVLVPVLGAGLLWDRVNGQAIREASVAVAAFAANPQAQSADETIVPDPLVAKLDIPRGSGDGCQQSLYASALAECVYGPEDASQTLVLVGNSHAMQWLPALEELAPSIGLRVVTMTKSDCPLLSTADKAAFMAADAQIKFVDAPSCFEWNRQAVARIISLKPDLVLTISTAGTGATEAVPGAFQTVWAALGEAGIPVLALRDNPRFPDDPVECAARYIEAPESCDKPRLALLPPVNPTADIEIPRVTFADLSDLFCDDARCWVVRDGLLVYRDGGHLTATFARAQADRIGALIKELLPTP